MTPDTAPRRTPSPMRRAALVAALLAGTTLGGFAVGHAANDTAQTTPVNPPSANVMPRTVPDFTNLVTQVKPAVVSITTKMKSRISDTDSMNGMPFPFPFGNMTPEGPRSRVVEARGSGFIIDANGTIVTNNHVVKDATSVMVAFDDGTELPAKVVGRDPRTDIAVLKVSADHKLPFIQLGNSRDVKPGEWVIAMGNPFGLGGTVTAGIVSAVSRDIGAGPYDQFIQIDAPINQGNSGGPLFTQDGKVIGMNTAILSPSGGSIGIGFAVPSDMIRTVVSQIEDTGHVTRGYVGVEVQGLTPATAKALQVKENAGALLAGVQPNGPAAKAGLQPGDIVQSVNGQQVRSPRDLALKIASLKPGEEASLQVLRSGSTKDIEVKVGEMPRERTASAEQPAQGNRGQLGLALAPLSPDMRAQLDVPDGTDGAVIQNVRPGSAAEQAGLKAGDVIVGVGNQTVGSPGEAVRAVRKALSGDNRAVALRIMRDGQPAFVGITVGENASDAG
ncbi:MAG: DegQ family serine endoprotease [Acetobacteraceae bacterium]